MPPKGKKRSAEEEEILRLEEEARLKAEQEEEERKRNQEERKQRLIDLYRSFKESRFASEETLSSQFNSSLNDEFESREERKKRESWEQWMDQSGKPDCNSAPSISSFVSKCLENEISRDDVFNERHLVHQLISQLKHLSLDYPENRDQYHQAIIKLNEMQEERLDQLTLNYLLNPSNHIDPESEDLLYESEDDLSGLIYLMWGNFGKNPRRREIEFENHKLKVELKKGQAIEDVALRVIYTSDDTLSFKLPESISIPPLNPPEGPLIDTWMIRPNDEIIEFFIILQNFQIQFDILPTGKLNLVEKGEKMFFPEGTKRTEIDFDTLVADLEQKGLFVFPNEESLKYLEVLEKVENVSNRAYSNIASVSHQKRITSSSYNPSLNENEMSFIVENDTVVCTSDRFYIIEDKYIPPEPPNPPKETEEEDQEAIDAYEEEKEKYDELIKEEESKFHPDFEIPRDGCPMLATLAEVLQAPSRISQQNLTVYKLLKKSMVLQL